MFGPADDHEVFAFLEWRATADLLAGGTFLHAGGVQLPKGNTLIIGEPGSGKSTMVAHLMSRGWLAWGDDLVRFAPESRMFSAVPRSLKLDDNSLKSLDLIRSLVTASVPGTLLATEWCFVSPASVRGAWEAPQGQPSAIVLLDRREHYGPARLEPMSTATAAIHVTDTVIGQRSDADRRTALATRVLESLGDAKAWAAFGGDPGDLARTIEEALA